MINTIDNTNLLNMCRDCGAVGFIPSCAYTYDAVAATITVTNSSTIPAGDTLKLVKVRAHDFYGNEIRGSIEATGGGDGYITAPTVSFSGGGGTGATAHAVMTGRKVTSIVIDAPGTGYTSDPTVVFTPTNGGSGAAATAHRTTTTVTSATIDAAATSVVLNVSTLMRAKPIAVTVTITTVGMIAADGGAYGFLAPAGDIGFWDVQKNA